MLQIRSYPGVPIKIEQDSEQPVRIEAAGSAAFLPPRFDPTRPYRIILQVEKGNYRLPDQLILVGK